MWALVRGATPHRRTLSCVLVDIDRFKSINDEHGHARGDAVLARVASRLQHVLREEDYAGRWGGEEFLILLPDIDEDGAHATAERLRASVGDRPVAGLRVTVSAGVATWASGESGAGGPGPARFRPVMSSGNRPAMMRVRSGRGPEPASSS